MSLIVATIVSVLMIAVDRITKAWAVGAFADRVQSIPVIRGILSFYYVENDGAGFSILSGRTIFLIVFSSLAMLFVLYLIVSRKLKSPVADWGLCLILSGGIGNLIDRITRGGRVVDFIKTDFIDFPIFNVADICVTVGAGLIILYFIIDTVKDARKKRTEKENKNEQN